MHCGIQYVEQTVADFHYRCNNYKDNCRKNSRNEDCMQEHLHDHYLSCTKDFLNIVSVTFIDKTEPSHSLQRTVLETYPTNQCNSCSEYSRWCFLVHV